MQKFILDWAEGEANQDIIFMFPVPFKEQNFLKQKNFSLMELLYYIFPEIITLVLLSGDSYRIMFIFDGLDECQFLLNFQNTQTSIKGYLLPSALLWITSLPEASGQIPADCVNQVTEV